MAEPLAAAADRHAALGVRLRRAVGSRGREPRVHPQRRRLLRAASGAGHCRGRLRSRRDVLPRAVDPDAVPRRRDFHVHARGADLRHLWRPTGGMAHECGQPRELAGMALDAAGGRPAHDRDCRRGIVVAAGPAARRPLAHRRPAPMDRGRDRRGEVCARRRRPAAASRCGIASSCWPASAGSASWLAPMACCTGCRRSSGICPRPAAICRWDSSARCPGSPSPPAWWSTPGIRTARRSGTGTWESPRWSPRCSSR